MTSLSIKMDVIRCPVSAGLNFHRTKLSQMAVEPRKPRKFRTAKIKDVASIYAHCMASKTIDPPTTFYPWDWASSVWQWLHSSQGDRMKIVALVVVLCAAVTSQPQPRCGKRLRSRLCCASSARHDSYATTHAQIRLTVWACGAVQTVTGLHIYINNYVWSYDRVQRKTFKVKV